MALLPPTVEPLEPMPSDARRPLHSEQGSSAELCPGDFYFSGVNVDTQHAHAYQLDGTCVLHADGSLTGGAEERSNVWNQPAIYRLGNGRWSADGHLSFLLEHSDYRGELFDPFLFHLDMSRALPPPVTAQRANRRDTRRTPAPAPAPGSDDDDEEEAWQAVGGWWKTVDSTSTAERGAGRHPTGAAAVGAYQGSSGRIKHLRLVRVGGGA